MAVFLQAHPPKPGELWHFEQRAARIKPTSDSMEVVAKTVRLLKRLGRAEHRYNKAGVVLDDLVREVEYLRSSHPDASHAQLLHLQFDNSD